MKWIGIYRYQWGVMVTCGTFLFSDRQLQSCLTTPLTSPLHYMNPHTLKWKSEKGEFVLIFFYFLLYLSYFHAGFAQIGCLFKPLLQFLYCYSNIYITLKFPLSCREKILMSSKYPTDIILEYFQSQKCFQSSSTDKKIIENQIP